MLHAEHRTPNQIEVVGPYGPRYDHVLTPEALAFVAELEELHRDRLDELLALREARQARFDSGERPDFLPHTRHVRESDWNVVPTPSDLMDRRVEITGPVDRKMIINAMNSGAQVFMADFEDSNAPSWRNVVEGQLNLCDAVRRTIEFEDLSKHKHYSLNPRTAVLMVRPRGLHLNERHVIVNGRQVSASLFDFGLFFFHNAHALIGQWTGPYFYLPKLQSHQEARWWNDVFATAQEKLGIAQGTIRATVLIETLPAVFEMDEILFELRDHAAGLNCGRWDYIFSSIKTLKEDSEFVLPDRGQVTMEQPFLRAYTQLLVKTCHRRGAHAIGGMAAQIPIRSDAEANAEAIARVRVDKEREVRDGHDGTWVAHPGLVGIAHQVFGEHMSGANQLDVRREDVDISAEELLEPPIGTRTEAGVRQNVRVGVQYLESWLRGTGCVPLNHLMEDAATAEISRTQLWQWIHHNAQLDDGRVIDVDLFHQVLDEELQELRGNGGTSPQARFDEAGLLFERLVTSPRLEEWLTIPAYQQLVSLIPSAKE